MTPEKFVKKPLPVLALQFTEDPESWADLLAFTNHGVRKYTPHVLDEQHYDAEVYDYLHDTWVKFALGDWIIEGLDGEFYPHEGAAFKRNYERFTE